MFRRVKVLLPAFPELWEVGTTADHLVPTDVAVRGSLHSRCARSCAGLSYSIWSSSSTRSVFRSVISAKFWTGKGITLGSASQVVRVTILWCIGASDSRHARTAIASNPAVSHDNLPIFIPPQKPR